MFKNQFFKLYWKSNLDLIFIKWEREWGREKGRDEGEDNREGRMKRERGREEGRICLDT